MKNGENGAPLTEGQLADLIINPFYAITIAPALCQEHAPIITKEQWVQTNRKLMQEIGTREWLLRLLDVLEGNYVANPE